MHAAKKAYPLPFILNLLKFISINIVLMLIIGFLTLDVHANTNSRLGAYILSFLLPYFIVSYTIEMSGLERLLKFGSGFVVYLMFTFLFIDFSQIVVSGIGPCLLISGAILYFGKSLIKKDVRINFVSEISKELG